MKSIRIRLMTVCLAALLLIFSLVSAVSFYYVQMSVNQQISQSLKMISEQKAISLNECFSAVERAVNELAVYVGENLDEKRFAKDEAYAASFLTNLESSAIQLSHVIACAKTFYFSPNIKIYGNRKTLYLVNPSDSFFSKVPYDISQYEQNDVTHVAWYYEPQKAEKPSWFGPYPNFNTESGIDTVSYAIPIYRGAVFLGVVGMDVTTQQIRNVIDNLSYETAFGFLVNSTGDILYHKDFPGGLSASDFAAEQRAVARLFTQRPVDFSHTYRYVWRGEKQRLGLHRLPNGMTVAVSVPESELHILQQRMLYQTIVLLIIVLFVSVMLLDLMAAHIIRPIQTITVAASRIARGELGTPVPVQTHDELGVLADSIGKIAVELKEYISYVNDQAYNDAMTRTKNKAAYIDRVKELDLRIAEDMAEFTVFVFDVNGLKRMNDTYGHEYGDMLIQDAASVLKQAFPQSSIYRTGGDEFVVLTDADSDEQRNERCKNFEQLLAIFNQEKTHYETPLTVSYGSATFDKELDKNFNAVFSRADEAMYVCKTEFYRTHADRRRR